MNTNQLKRFAQEARRKLLEQVGAKLNFVLTTDSAELREKTEQLKQLRQELGRTTKEQLIEKVAYTWFNRLMALRFMDVNDYQPLGIRIITPKDGYTIPELLDEAKRGNIPEELKVNRQKIYDLLDNKIPSTNPQNEAYKELLIATCNYLSTTFSFLFEKINDYTELLLPDDLTSDFSILKDVRDGMLVEECVNVEIIGWLYQFYISEEKERLINAKQTYKANEIATVTQLFTPKWIVQYIVENTLAQFWREARPTTNIIKELQFYIKPKDDSIISKRNIKSPEEIKLFDPCVGSAHILCYAFDILYKIYEEEGYSSNEIPTLIINKNLFGCDIDERATQLAGFALMMKARHYNRRVLTKNITPNIMAFKNIESHRKFKNAELFGSLIKLEEEDFNSIEVESDSIFSVNQSYLKKQASFLVNKYDILVTNPPYLNSAYMEGRLKQFIDSEYKTTKSDLFSCFIMQATWLTKKEGIIGLLSPFVWLFLHSYEFLRSHIITNTTLASLIQLEYNAFGAAVVPVCTFILRNSYVKSYNGTYIRLSEFKGIENQAPRTLEAIKNTNCNWRYYAKQDLYKKIPSNIIAYWLPEQVPNIFVDNKSLADTSIIRKGIFTGDNNRFIRYWFEIPQNNIGHDIHTEREAINSEKKWYYYVKGGAFRKYYGNHEFVLNYQYNGKELSHFDGSGISVAKTLFYYEGLVWSKITNYRLSFRFKQNNIQNDDASPMIKKSDEINIYYLIALLNSEVANYFMKFLSPTMSNQAGDIGKMPIIVDKNFEKEIESITKEVLIEISKQDWDTSELSWDFKNNELIKINDLQEFDIEETTDTYIQNWKNKFLKLLKTEEYVNQKFISIYNLENEINPSVGFEDVTILQNILDRNVLMGLTEKRRNTKSIDSFDFPNDISLPFLKEEILRQLLSYAIGCMFGRYSLDNEGMILVNQGENLVDYYLKISKTNKDCSFHPDVDNIIPILDDEWFDDDLVGRFYNFLKVTFGERNFNKNLAFIEEQIGRSIRKYFIKDFYPDHIKRYSKRPIYWMFSSPKGSFNVLIYMHRYTPDTVSNILNKYLKEFIGKLNTRKEHLERLKETGSASDKSKAYKESDYIQKMLVELHEYERDVLYPLATERIEIDLDDGVLVNYNKFGKAVKEVNGLNDPATKKKVKQFDWIDTSQIR